MFHYKNVTMQNVPNFVSIIDMNLIENYIIHGNTCKCNHKKWHYKNSHIDIKYHMTPNTSFSIVEHNFYCMIPNENIKANTRSSSSYLGALLDCNRLIGTRLLEKLKKTPLIDHQRFLQEFDMIWCIIRCEYLS